MIKKYQKKPVVIEAVQFTGDNKIECIDFTNKQAWAESEKDKTGVVKQWYLVISTFEGNHRADVGDFIIKGAKGEFYPCKPDIFTETYEEVIVFRA